MRSIFRGAFALAIAPVTTLAKSRDDRAVPTRTLNGDAEDCGVAECADDDEENRKAQPHIGSSVDDFFAEDGLLEKIDVAAVKRVIYESAKYVLLPTV